MGSFYRRFVQLCSDRRVSPSGVAKAVGLSNAAATGWKNGKIPSDTTVEKLAQYFGVTPGYLLDGDTPSVNELLILDQGMSTMDITLLSEPYKKPTAESSEPNDETTAILHDFIRTSTEEERQELIKFSEFIKSKRKEDKT